MIKRVLACALLLFVFCTCNGQNKTEPGKEIKPKNKYAIKVDSLAWSKRLKVKTYKPGWVDSEVVSQGVILQNSYQKGHLKLIRWEKPMALEYSGVA